MESAQVIVSECGGACPTQAEGIAPSGRPFYFRARHGDWRLCIGPEGGGDYLSWADDGEIVAEGDDDTYGFMEDEAVVEILNRELANR